MECHFACLDGAACPEEARRDSLVLLEVLVTESLGHGREVHVAAQGIHTACWYRGCDVLLVRRGHVCLIGGKGLCLGNVRITTFSGKPQPPSDRRRRSSVAVRVVVSATMYCWRHGMSVHRRNCQYSDMFLGVYNWYILGSRFWARRKTFATFAYTKEGSL